MQKPSGTDQNVVESFSCNLLPAMEQDCYAAHMLLSFRSTNTLDQPPAPPTTVPYSRDDSDGERDELGESKIDLDGHLLGGNLFFTQMQSLTFLQKVEAII